jgi:putative hydrolase of the HAD superfamily
MIEMQEVKLVVFDLDDTLYPEAEFVEGGFRNIGSMLAEGNLNLTRQILEKMKYLLHAGRRDIFQVVLADLKRQSSPEQITELVRVYRTTDRPLKLFLDADLAIDRYRGSGLILGMVTDGPVEAQKTKVRLLDIEKRLDRIVYTEQYGPEFGKPCPHCFELLMKEFGVEPGQCVYIADNESKDFVAPNLLHWRTIKIVRSGGIYLHHAGKDEQYKAGYTIHSFDELSVIPVKT